MISILYIYRISIFNIIESSCADDEERLKFIPVAIGMNKTVLFCHNQDKSALFLVMILKHVNNRLLTLFSAWKWRMQLHLEQFV